jgi:sugar (pentulose or hexulose) kinase
MPSALEMTPSVVVAYDVGTSGVKAVVVDAAGRVLGSRVRSYGLSTPRTDEVEQDVDAIATQLGVASREVIADVGLDPSDVAAVGLTAQMFSVVALDANGLPIRPMLSWLDQRSAAEAARIRLASGPDDGYAIFDSVLTAKDIAPRIAWLEAHEPETARRTAWYVDCKEAVAARLTGVVAIDPAGASAFRLVDPRTDDWDLERCRLAGVPIDRLPPILAATNVIGHLTPAAAGLTGLRVGTPVACGTGDVAASQIGAGAVDPGDVHLSLGTAVYFGILASTQIADPGRRLGPLRHIAPPGWLLWLEIATGGAALSWLDRQIAGLGGSVERDYAAVDRAVEAVAAEMEGLQFVPWLTGERVPLFDDAARAAFVGLALHHGQAHLIRAVMEGVASQIAWAYEYGLAYGITPGTIRAVGGGTIGGLWTRLIADALDRPLEIVAEPQDAGARGAAACALVAAGLADDVRSAVPPAIERIVVPDAAGTHRAMVRLATFRRLYPALRAASGRVDDAAVTPEGPLIRTHDRPAADALA